MLSKGKYNEIYPHASSFQTPIKQSITLFLVKRLYTSNSSFIYPSHLQFGQNKPNSIFISSLKHITTASLLLRLYFSHMGKLLQAHANECCRGDKAIISIPTCRQHMRDGIQFLLFTPIYFAQISYFSF